MKIPYHKQLDDWKARRKAIIKRLSKGETGAEIARSIGVTRQAISRAARKESFAK
jgi:transcriptional regulator with XRE-family HTH domain